MINTVCLVKASNMIVIHSWTILEMSTYAVRFIPNLGNFNTPLLF